MNRRSLALLIGAMLAAMIFGCSLTMTVGSLAFGWSVGDFLALGPAATATPTKTFLPTFTATPTIVPSPTATLAPTSTPEPPTPTQPPTPTAAPPTNTPTPRPPAPSPTPKPPPPTNTPQPVYEFFHKSGPTKDACHAGWCFPEISGIVIDAEGNPLDNFNPVWIKLDSSAFGVLHCRTGDEAQALQPGHFKFNSPDGQLFRDYTLTVVRNPGGQALSAPLHEKMNSVVKGGQQTNIVFQRTH